MKIKNTLFLGIPLPSKIKLLFTGKIYISAQQNNLFERNNAEDKTYLLLGACFQANSGVTCGLEEKRERNL